MNGYKLMVVTLVFFAGALAAADVANSQFSVSVSWTSDPDTGDDVLRGYVQFKPPESAADCSQIRFVQVARVETSPAVDLQ